MWTLILLYVSYNPGIISYTYMTNISHLISKVYLLVSNSITAVCDSIVSSIVTLQVYDFSSPSIM